MKISDIIHYHGSPAREGILQTGFDYAFVGKGNDQWGFGFYFTNNVDVARGYGDVVRAKLNIKNPIVSNDDFSGYPRLNRKQVRQIILAAPHIKDMDETPLWNWGDLNSKSFQSVLSDAITAFVDNERAYFLLFLDLQFEDQQRYNRIFSKVTGYDGIIVNFSNGDSVVVAFFPEQIEILRDLDENVRGFHGGKHGRFEKTHIGINSTVLGIYETTRYGAFFSDNPEFSKMYGEVRQYEIQIPPSKIIDLDNNPNFIWNFTHNWVKDRHPDLYQDAKYTTEIWMFFDEPLGEAFIEYLSEQGYKAASFEEWTINDAGVEIHGNSMVVFDPGAVIIPVNDEQPDLFDQPR